MKKLMIIAGSMSLLACSEAPSDQNDTLDPNRGVSFYVMVKSANYSQDENDNLTFLNNHMFSEIFIDEGVELKNATLTRDESANNAMPYEKRDHDYYVEGGHFDSVDELDTAFPNGDYTFNFEMQGRTINQTMNIAGPNGETDIPEPVTINFYQGDKKTSPTAIDPGERLTIRWSEYSNGRKDPKNIVDDMVFVVMADCYGERITHTGLPFQGDYTKFDTKEIIVEAEFLKTGHPYSIFVELPHVVDSSISSGVPGFTSYATATYMDVLTTGPDTSTTCPVVKVPMDTGQTDRMDVDNE